MKIKYNTLKGKRYKKGTIKSKKYKKRIRIFDSIECNDYWWSDLKKEWITYSEWQNQGNISTNYNGVTNTKQLIRHMKKHSKYLPKGTIFTLKSNFIGINSVTGIL